jgi:hypothetical protein
MAALPTSLNSSIVIEGPFIERGLNELRHPDSLLPPHRSRKKGVAAKAV